VKAKFLVAQPLLAVGASARGPEELDQDEMAEAAEEETEDDDHVGDDPDHAGEVGEEEDGSVDFGTTDDSYQLQRNDLLFNLMIQSIYFGIEWEACAKFHKFRKEK
jgi:hypothetical protein